MHSQLIQLACAKEYNVCSTSIDMNTILSKIQLSLILALSGCDKSEQCPIPTGDRVVTELPVGSLHLHVRSG